MLKDLSTRMVAMVFLYIFSLAYGLNFIFTAISLGVGGLSFLLASLIILLPMLFLFLYFMRSHIEMLYGTERALRIAYYITTLVAVVFVIIFILPITY